MRRLPRDARIEDGSWKRLLGYPSVAIVAQYSASHETGKSLGALIESLHEAGCGVAVISTSEAPQRLRFVGADEPDLVVRRPNIGYDFGSWAWAILEQDELGQHRTLLLNDSLAGPFRSAAWVYERFLTSSADVWGMIGSGQGVWHIQSYCVGFSPGVLGNAVVRKFWRAVAPQPSKLDVINKYELGQTRMLLSEGFTVDVVVPPGLLIDRALNPAILAWRQLLDIGIPFVKKELIRDPSVAPDAAEIPDELARRYGVDIKEWL